MHKMYEFVSQYTVFWEKPSLARGLTHRAGLNQFNPGLNSNPVWKATQ